MFFCQTSPDARDDPWQGVLNMSERLRLRISSSHNSMCADLQMAIPTPAKGTDERITTMNNSTCYCFIFNLAHERAEWTKVNLRVPHSSRTFGTVASTGSEPAVAFEMVPTMDSARLAARPQVRSPSVSQRLPKVILGCSCMTKQLSIPTVELDDAYPSSPAML